MTTTTHTTAFTNPDEAKAFGLGLKIRGITCQVRVNPAKPEVVGESPCSASAEAEISLFAERGEELGQRALAWAKASPWWSGDLYHAVSCLSSDLDDGCTNGAASAAQAALFIKRLSAALSRAPKVSVVVAPAKPQSWDIVWEEPEDGSNTDSDDVFGASIGSDGWRCD